MILYVFFFFNDTATTEIYTLSLHDALPIWPAPACSHTPPAGPSWTTSTSPNSDAGPYASGTRAPAALRSPHPCAGDPRSYPPRHRRWPGRSPESRRHAAQRLRPPGDRVTPERHQAGATPAGFSPKCPNGQVKDIFSEKGTSSVRTYIDCRFSTFLSRSAALTWPDASYLIDLSPGSSHRSVISLNCWSDDRCDLSSDDQPGDAIVVTQGDRWCGTSAAMHPLPTLRG